MLPRVILLLGILGLWATAHLRAIVSEYCVVMQSWTDRKIAPAETGYTAISLFVRVATQLHHIFVFANGTCG